MFEELIQIFALHLTGYIESRLEAAVFFSVIRVLGPLNSTTIHSGNHGHFDQLLLFCASCW